MPERVALVINSLNIGGAELMLTRLAGSLVSRRVEPTVIALSPGGVLARSLAEDGVTVVELPRRPALGGTGTLAALRQALRRVRPDVVHTWLYKADLFGLLAARLAGIRRVVWDIRCSVVGPGDETPSIRLRPLLAALSTVPSAVVANSTAGRVAHERYGYRPRRWSVIHNGVDLARFAPSKRNRTRLDSDLQIPVAVPVVICLARYHPLKDHDTLLRALPSVWARRPDVHCLLAGANVVPENRAFADALAQGRGRLHLLGERHDVEYLLASSDLTIMSSTSEGFPNVVAESMACGTPCVATNVGDAEEILGSTGATVPVRDAEMLAMRVVDLLSEPETLNIQRRDAARRRIEAEFSLSHATSRYIELYNSL